LGRQPPVRGRLRDGRDDAASGTWLARQAMHRPTLRWPLPSPASLTALQEPKEDPHPAQKARPCRHLKIAGAATIESGVDIICYGQLLMSDYS